MSRIVRLPVLAVAAGQIVLDELVAEVCGCGWATLVLLSTEKIKTLAALRCAEAAAFKLS